MVRRYISVVSIRSLTGPLCPMARPGGRDAGVTRGLTVGGGWQARHMASTSVMWFRRDLRLHDNPALLAACAADEVVPLFVLDPHLWERAGQVRRAYLAASLRALDESLGGHLVVRRGDPREVVPAVAREVAALTVHLAADYGPYGSRRDEEV